jgi:SAM-dependent methyltransferase
VADLPPFVGPAAAHWAARLAEWALPQEIVDQASVPPWAHDVATFAVDDTLDRETTSARWAREVLPPAGGTVLDVGCGGGRSSLALVPPASELIGVDQSEAMLDAFAEACARAGVARRTVQGSWPDVAPETPIVDVVVCHHVFYNVADLVPFALALTDHARLAVVVELPPRHPQSALNAAWRHFWGIERPDGPTDLDAIDVLREAGLDPEVTRSPRGPLSRSIADPAAALASARRRLCLTADRDDELAEYLEAHPLAWMPEVTTLRWAGEGRL